jgi:hypothetical protein
MLRMQQQSPTTFRSPAADVFIMAPKPAAHRLLGIQQPLTSTVHAHTPWVQAMIHAARKHTVGCDAVKYPAAPHL